MAANYRRNLELRHFFPQREQELHRMNRIYGGVEGDGAGAGGQGERGEDGSFGWILTVTFGWAIQNEPTTGPASGSGFQSSASGMGAGWMQHVFQHTPPPVPEIHTQPGHYCSQLIRQGRGFPLHYPAPQVNLPAEYQRTGVAIGDVGRITTQGDFDFLFNIYLPANHPINPNVPDDFVPLVPYDPVDVACFDFESGNYVATPSVTDVGHTEFPGGEFAFNCVAPSVALLCLPNGARLQKLENLEAMRRYAAKNAASWYKYAKGARGRALANGDLHLITGCEKAASWGMATFYNPILQGNFQIKFRPTQGEAEGFRYRWQGPCCHWKHHDAPPVPGTPLNHTTFVHTFTVSISQRLWEKLFDPTLLDRLRSWYFRYGTTKFFPPSPKITNPSQIINERILREAPRAKVVITHTDDWRDVLKHG
ncbi:hypothetical protein C8R45DRAFT_326236 [Mycena sanguinolenta]|nr:hypothetical protein C8R45DRAFT_326236 [Mycena sanguinolenta]